MVSTHAASTNNHLHSHVETYRPRRLRESGESFGERGLDPQAREAPER